MHWLIHFIGADYGLPYGHLGVYNFWSGFGSDVGEIAIVGSLIELARRGVRHHRERLAQSAAHHAQRLAQDAEHHRAHLELLRRHHAQVLDSHAALAAPAAPDVVPPAAARARAAKAAKM